MTSTQRTVGVVIGRFQVPSLHDGHRTVIDRAASENETLAVVIGLCAGRPDARNPLSYEARAEMIRDSYPDADIIPLPDRPSDEAWSQNLDRTLAHRYDGCRIRLYGSRDSFIPSYHGTLERVEIAPIDYPSGTEIRDSIAGEEIHDERFRAGVISTIVSRPPVSYVSVDIAVIDPASGRVLLGRKDSDPEGRYRFPGGFLDITDRSLEEAAARELVEETSLQASGFRYLGSFPIDDWRYRRSPDRVFSAFFVATPVSGDAAGSDDLKSVSWFETDRLHTVIIDEHLPLAERLLIDLED